MSKDCDETTKKFLEDKRSQALRLNEPELRDFEQKLRNIHILKEQKCQIKEKEYERLQKEVQMRRESEEAQVHKMLYEKCESALKVSASVNKLEYGNELKLQMDLKKNRDLLKKEIDECDKINHQIIKKEIEIDKTRKVIQKVQHNKSIKKEMELFEKFKKVTMEKEKWIQVKEEQAIEEFKKYEECKNKKYQDIKDKKVSMRNEIYEIIAAKMLAQQKAKEERQKLLDELLQHEYAQKQLEKEKDEANIGTFKKEIIKILQTQIAANKAHQERLRLEELQYRDHLMKQIQEYNQQEYERIIEDQIKTFSYALDLYKQIEQNKLKEKDEAEKLKRTDDYIRDYNDKIKRDIENEKAKLIQEYSKS